VAELMQHIRRTAADHICQAAASSDGLRLDFDPAREGPVAPGDCEVTVPASPIQKIVQRTVVSLHHGRFQAREIVRQQTHNSGPVIERSALLADTVASGGRYAFDLISHVGVESYLRGRSLQDIRQELIDRRPPLDIPISSLWDQQQKFLFYLGHLHAQASHLLRQYLAEHGPVTWLLDGTTEPGTPVFLGIKEAAHGILLAGWKIPSENTADIAVCLQQAAARYGRPNRVLHDLSPTISSACDQALPGVSHDVCHYHLAHDVGKDLYEKPQGALCKRMRALELQFHLKKQRYRQTECLRHQLDSPAQLMLRRLMAGSDVKVDFNQTLSREVLLAFHFWILDYRSDGHQRGFPFDPYTLYLHRRLVRAGLAVDSLLSHHNVARQAPPVLFNFQKQLQNYRSDAQITAAADLYERSCCMFARLRNALRLSAENMRNLRQAHELPTDQQHEIKTALDSLRSELRQQAQDENDADRPSAEIVLKHLEKYWPCLVPDQTPAEGERWHRTTNQLEKDWGHLKRRRRQAHGRGSLTRDFAALPEEYTLVLNLQNATYVDLVLGGSLDAIPSKLAEASHEAGPFYVWQQRRRPQLFGQLPRRLLRAEEFIHNLIEACEHHCQDYKAVA
jgi:hypothetical protein